MTKRLDSGDFDQVMRSWLEAEAGVIEPAGLAERVVARTRHTRRAPAWLVRERWVPERAVAPIRAARRTALILAALALVLAAIALVAFVVGSRTRVPAPFGLATNGRLVYDTNAGIFEASPEGGSRPLIDSVRKAAGAIFSPDGTRLVFWGDGSPDSLFVAKVDGTGIRKLVGDLWISTNQKVSWAPDNHRLVLSTENGPDRLDEQLVIVDTNTGAVTRLDLRTATFTRALVPSWSPDGQWIAFEGIPADSPKPPAYWVVRPDGSGARQLATSRVPANLVDPRWAPDPGRVRLAYTAVATPLSPFGVYVLDLASGEETRISAAGEDAILPTWSPDGARLAWLTGPNQDGVKIAPVADPTRTVTLPERDAITAPIWSPDGTRLYTLGLRRATLIVLSVDGSIPTVRIPHDPSQALPDWQRVAG
jgi:Tol biopolymer transport system component